MKKIKKFVAIIIVIAIVLTGCVVGFNYIKNKYIEEGRKQEQAAQAANEVKPNETEIIKQRFEVAAKLVTADCISTCVDHYVDAVNMKEDLKIPLDANLPLTKKSFLLSYDGTVSAGIKDLTQAEIKDNGNGTITVKLPEIVVFDTTVDNNSMVVYDENNNLVNKLTLKDYNDAMIRIKDKIKAEAIENGLVSKAKANAETIIQGMLAGLESEIIIEWEK